MPCQTRSRAKCEPKCEPKCQIERPARYLTRYQTRCQLGFQPEFKSRILTGCRTRRQIKRQTRCTAGREVKPPTTFNSLPTEIRCMIWEEFVRTPRIIHVDLRAIDPGAYPGYAVKIQLKDRIPFWCASTQVRQVCPILGVNRESRHIAMKEPLVIFALSIPMAHPEIFNDASVTHQFAMRRHDFLFIKGCESWRLGQIWNSGTTSQIANVIIDIDVHNINYQSAGRIPRWITVIRKGTKITDLLKNKECLENFYCLVQDTTANGEQHLELDDLCELTVDRFPEHMHDLTTWLADFRKFPVNDSWGLIPFHDDDIKLYNKWKNITVRERE